MCVYTEVFIAGLSISLVLKPDEQGNYLKKDYSLGSFPRRLKEAITSSYIKWRVVILDTFWISNALNHIYSRTKNINFYLYVSTVFKPVAFQEDFIYARYLQSSKIKMSDASMDASWCWESDSKCQISGACCAFEPCFLWLSFPEGINYGRVYHMCNDRLC